jgi:hypothetical protein
MVGAAAGPLGALAGAILGALAGAATGCLVGAKAGALIDAHVLKHHACDSCGHVFAESTGLNA